MHRNIARLTALCLILLALISTAEAKRSLLRPPDGYKGVEINGVKYVLGQVYVAQFADTTALKPYGFRGFETMGSSVYYKKVKAIWPLALDYDTLPDLVVGLNYEKVKSEDDMKRAYAQNEGDMNLRGYPTFGTYYNGPVSYNNGTQYYGSPYSGGSCYRDGRPGSYAPYWAWPHDYNPDAYYYRTTTRTNLKPTTIGAYPSNPSLIRKNWGGGRIR